MTSKMFLIVLFSKIISIHFRLLFTYSKAETNIGAVLVPKHHTEGVDGDSGHRKSSHIQYFHGQNSNCGTLAFYCQRSSIHLSFVRVRMFDCDQLSLNLTEKVSGNSIV